MNQEKSCITQVLGINETEHNSGIYRLRLRVKNFSAADFGTGRFVALKPLNGAAMVRPFTIAWTNAAKSEITLFIKTVGQENSNSRLYAKLKPGDEVEMFSPYGQSFELLPKIDNYLLVAGGTGQAAMFPVAKKIIHSDKRLDFLVGVKNETELFGLDLLRKMSIERNVIEQEGEGQHGLATDLLDIFLRKNIPRTAVIACGPKPMLKKVFDLCQANNIPCLVSVEGLMACACYSCKGCAIEMIDGTILNVCKQGPIFNAYLINWEKFLPPPPVILHKGHAENPFAITLHGQNGHTLELPYPWMIASGCIGIDEAENTRPEKIGAYVTKGVELDPRSGNHAPRICETSHGMINSIGLPNIGIYRFIKEELPRLISLGKQVIVNISGKSIAEYTIITEKLKPFPNIVYEVNVSCPNVENGGMAFGTDSEATFKIMYGIRLIDPDRFIIVKLTPNVTDIGTIASAAFKGGADALTVSNTLVGMDIDVETLLPKINRITGGYSGPAVLPIILAKVHQVHQAKLGIPIIGCGGITSGEDVLKYFIKGASAVMVGTGWFTNKNIFNEITTDVSSYLTRHNTDHISNLVGKMLIPK